MRRTITVGPFALMFTNQNTTMALRTHSHLALVTLTYETLGEVGFPSFAETHAELQQELTALTAHPFRDATNERVADVLWANMAKFPGGRATQKWGGEYRLVALELAVRGVPDAIGHADAFTTYRVEA
jgi:hypothetical protein